MSSQTSLITLIFIVVLSFAGSCLAADKDAPKIKELIDAEDKHSQTKAESPKAIPTDQYDRGTPRTSVVGLSEALDKRDYKLAMQYVDLRNVPGSISGQGQELARQLKIIADRSLWVDVETISNDPQGHADDELPSHVDIVARIKTPEGPVNIQMQRTADAEGIEVWKLSNRTVAEIPRLYKHFGYGKYGDKLSRILPEYEILGLEVWQWAMLLFIALPAFLVSWAITYVCKILIGLVKKTPLHRVNRFLAGPVRFAVFLILSRYYIDLISPTHTIKAILEAETFLILAVVWLVNGGIELGFGRLRDRMRALGNEHATVLLRPASTLLKVLIWVIALISWLDNLGFNVTTMIAGLGVGGIAIGLAAQKSIENLIGGITLYAAEPIRIGDFCRAGTILGVVDEIGVRFTTLRTMDRTLVTIPNANLVNMDIENFTRRDKILYKRTLRLRNDTTPDQIRTVLDEVGRMLKDHPEVDPEPARIRFTEYGEHSLNLEIFTYIKTKDFNEYLGIVEDLNLRTLNIVSAAGAQLALPARSIRLEGQAGIDSK